MITSINFKASLQERGERLRACYVNEHGHGSDHGHRVNDCHRDHVHGHDRDRDCARADLRDCVHAHGVCAVRDCRKSRENRENRVYVNYEKLYGHVHGRNVVLCVGGDRVYHHGDDHDGCGDHDARWTGLALQ